MIYIIVYKISKNREKKRYIKLDWLYKSRYDTQSQVQTNVKKLKEKEKRLRAKIQII